MIITKYYHISIRVLHLITKLISDISEDQGEEVVVKHPIIQYLWKALNVLCQDVQTYICDMWGLREDMMSSTEDKTT